MARVTLTGVSKVYPGGVSAASGINLDIADGELLVLVGPSGCGKSTTLRLIAGLEELSAGTVAIDGRVVNQTPPRDRDIAMVFQNYAMYPHMNVHENLAFGLKLRRRELGLSKAEIEVKVRQAAAMLGIEALLDRKPGALSGGQRQRVALGRAIVRRPKAYLFDEPLSNLDARMRVEMRGELKSLQRRLGTTTIHVTHDQEEAMSLADRLAVMKDGSILQCDCPEAVYERPVNRFVAGFLGSPAMSFLEGRIAGDSASPVFEVNGTRIPLKGLGVRPGVQAGRPMVLGVRPDGFLVGEPSGAGKAESVRLEVRVRLVEPLGDRKDVHAVGPGGQSLIGRLDGRLSVSEGQEMSLWLDMAKVHLFEAGEMGMNVSASTSGAKARGC